MFGSYVNLQYSQRWIIFTILSLLNYQVFLLNQTSEQLHSITGVLWFPKKKSFLKRPLKADSKNE